jgi:xanthine dehydrogenase/oxidase
LYSCDGLKLTTVEGLGNKTKGFHPIQKTLADFNGSQCGWCSSGMVMNMYSLLFKNPKPTKAEIEASFDGNICRCTGKLLRQSLEKKECLNKYHLLQQKNRL